MNPIFRFIPPLIIIVSGAFGETLSSMPPVVARYEQMLVKSPEKGTAFDKVYQYYFENEGLEKLADHWRTNALSPDAQKLAEPYQLLLGLLAERQGNAEEARKAFTEATKLAPVDSRAWRALGDFETHEGKFTVAIAAFEKALTSNPPATERAAIYRQLAHAKQRNLDAAGALATWQKMAEEFPNDPFVIEEVAEAQLESEKFEDARKSYAQLRDLAGTDSFKKVTATIRLAQVDERQGKIKEALALYESALPEASETSWIHRDLRARIEEVYRRQDDLPGLVGYYEKWLKTHDKDIEAATRLSGALVELNRQKEAVVWMQKAVVWAPDRHELQIDLAKLLRETDQALEAQKIVTSLTQSSPEELSYWQMLGDIEWQLFKKTNDSAHKKAAIEAWQSLAPKEIKDASRVSNLADILHQNGLNDEALVQFERAVSIAPDASDLRERWAGFLFELRRDDEAWKVLDGLVAGTRATAPNYKRLATLQIKYGKLDPALDSIKKGVALAPGEYSMLALQWRILSERKDWEAAAALYEPMLAAAPAMVEQTELQYLQALRAANQIESTQKLLIEKLPSANESEIRLMTRLALQSDDLTTTRLALDEGKKRFPDSLPLARLESEHAKRSGDFEARIATLRRLITLDPKQSADFLQEIAKSYQEQQKWDQALAVAQEWITTSPANADAQLFAANLNFAANRPSVGISKLCEAIKLSEKPNPIRMRLAQAYSQEGNLAKAQQTAEEAFETEAEASVKISILRQLSEFYFQQGRIDTLIARFKERQRSEEGGWRYALYLSEIFQQMQDYGQAREELAKSLASRPKDPARLRQLLHLAEQEGNTAAQARYYKALAEVEPSAANFAALAEALAESGDNPGAIQIMIAHQEDFLTDPVPWRMVFAKVQKQEAATSLNTALENALRQRPDDFNGRLTLAEMQIALNHLKNAQLNLWEIRKMPKPAQVSLTPTPNPSLNGYGPYGGHFSATDLRIQHSYDYQQSFNQLINSQQSYGSYQGRRNYYRNGFSPGGTSSSLTAPTFEQTRDKALIYLAAIALRENKVKEFLADLESDLAAQNADRTERFICFSLVQSRDQLWQEIKLQADAPGGGVELDQLCLNQLPQFLGQPNQPSPEAAEAGVLMEKLTQRIAKKDPKQAFLATIMRYGLLTSYGSKEEAKKLLPGLMEKLDETDPTQLQYIYSIAIETGDLEKASRSLKKIEEHSKGSKYLLGNAFWMQSRLAQAYLAQKDVKSAIQLYVQCFTDSLPTQPGGTSPSLSQFQSGNFFMGNRGIPQMPYSNRYINDQRLSFLRQTYQALKQENVLDATLEAFSKAEVPSELQIYPHLACVYLNWFDNKKEAALKELLPILDSNPDDELRLLVAGMEGELDKIPTAIAQLDQITTRQGNVYKQAQQLMLQLAKQIKDTDNARKAALRLVSLRPPHDEIRQLLPDLKELGLTEKVEQIEKQITNTGSRLKDLNERVQLMNSYLHDNKSEEGIAQAKLLLAMDPFSNTTNGDYYRGNALNVLVRFKVLDDYIADLEKQSDAAPASARLCMLLAEAWATKDAIKGEEWYQKVITLKPDDSGLKFKLIEMLQSKNQPDEAFKISQELLTKEPGLLFGYGFDFIGLYNRMKKLPELAEVVSKQTIRPINPNGGGNNQTASFCVRLGQELRKENKELAIQVWYKGIELTSLNNQFQSYELKKDLIETLAELGRKDEVLAQIDDLYFPTAQPKQLLLGMYTNTTSNWMNSTSNDGSGDVTYPGLEPLRTVEKLNSLDAMRKKAEARPEQDDSIKCLLLVIRARQRDPKLLEDLPKLLADSNPNQRMQSGLSNSIFLRVLSRELNTWPEGQKLVLDLLLQAKKVADLNPGNPMESTRIRHQILRIALEQGQQDLARKTAKEWSDLILNSGPNQYFDNDQTVGTIRLIFDLGMLNESEKLITFLKSTPNGNYLIQPLAELESQIALFKGEVPNPQAIACPAGEENGKSVILWEIHSATNQPKSSAVPFFGIKSPQLDGRWDIELQVLIAPNMVRRVALIPKAASCGQWIGKLPEGTFRVQAVLHSQTAKQEDLSALGIWVPISSSANLLSNPNFTHDSISTTTGSEGGIKGWEQTPELQIKPGGPRPGGSLVSIQFNTQKDNPLLGEKIPVEKGKEYLQSGWVRIESSGNSFNYGIRFFDKEGKEVGKTQCLNNGIQKNTWTFGAIHLSTTGGSNKQRIPNNAVFLQPYLETRGEISLQSLFLGEIASSKLEIKPDTIPSPQVLACPAGTENGKSVILWEIQPFNESNFESSTNFTFSEKSDPKFNELYNIELMYGTSPNTLIRFALIPKAKVQGKWNGEIPEGNGYIKARLHPLTDNPTDFLDGVGSVPFVNVQNLIPNPRFDEIQTFSTTVTTVTTVTSVPLGTTGSVMTTGTTITTGTVGTTGTTFKVKDWEATPAFDLKNLEIQPGGPRPDGTQIAMSISGKNPVILTADKIPVKPEKI